MVLYSCDFDKRTARYSASAGETPVSVSSMLMSGEFLKSLSFIQDVSSMVGVLGKAALLYTNKQLDRAKCHGSHGEQNLTLLNTC